MFGACTDQILEFRWPGGGTHMKRVQFLELFESFWFYRGNGFILKPSTCTKYPYWFPNHPQSVLRKGNVNTRSSQAQPLYKIDKLVATGGPFKPELSILESCCASRYGKGQGCLLTKFLSLELKEAGSIWTESSFWNFLNLFDFIKTMGPHWSRVHARTPSDFRIIPNPSQFQAMEMEKQRQHAQCSSKTSL